jgi:NAD(P)-dependent dehydrogenase (short-subunit alcohol dehydrogenase family)
LSYGFDRLPYVASKHAIVGLSEALATYLGPKGVGVTCLCPSGVITNVLEGITVYGDATSTPRAPAHPIVTAEQVGKLTADAVEGGRFLVVTASEVRDSLLARANDIEAYLQASIEAQE